MTDLKIALARAKESARFETELREILIYAIESAELATVLQMGQFLNDKWEDIAKCPTEPQSVANQQPEPNQKGRGKRRK